MHFKQTNGKNQVRPANAGRTVPLKHTRLWQRKRWLLPAVFVVLPLLVLWRPLQRKYLTYLLLRFDAPSSEVLADVIGQADDANSLLMCLWQTERIRHRRFVLIRLGRIVHSESAILHAMERGGPRTLCTTHSELCR